MVMQSHSQRLVNAYRHKYDMHIKDILAEAQISPGIRVALRQKGYKELGSGVDQQAWLEPKTGLVLKIFGRSEQKSKGQDAFFEFVKFCRANPNNQFLPQISGWQPFYFKGHRYLQIRIERMFPIDEDLGEALSDFAMAACSGRNNLNNYINKNAAKQAGSWGDNPGRKVHAELFTHVGEQGLKELWNTIVQLNDMAKRHPELSMDLHGGNFMFGSDGHIVISDPFVSTYS
jgi:hypothetical protein